MISDCQSEGLAPLPKRPQGAAGETAATSVRWASVYKQHRSCDEPVACLRLRRWRQQMLKRPRRNPQNKPKAGFFGKIGHFFRRIFGAE